jgi:hypothetical protein
MTEQEFAAKCEWEGVEYAVTEYGLTAADVEEGTPVHAAMLAVDSAKKPWMDAIRNLEAVLEDVDDVDDEA